MIPLIMLTYQVSCHQLSLLEINFDLIYFSRQRKLVFISYSLPLALKQSFGLMPKGSTANMLPLLRMLGNVSNQCLLICLSVLLVSLTTTANLLSKCVPFLILINNSNTISSLNFHKDFILMTCSVMLCSVLFLPPCFL